MRHPRKLGKLLIALLGLLMVAFMTVEVAHTHASAGNVSATNHCQLCAITQVAAVGKSTTLNTPVLYSIADVSIGTPLPSSRRVVLTSYIRPPPAGGSALL